MQSAWQKIENVTNAGDRSAEALAAWAQVSSIVESSDDGIISSDLNSVITTWNAGAESIYGYSAQEVIGRSIEFLIPPDRANEVDAILERLRSGQRVQNFETVRVKKGGELIDLSLTISPIHDGSRLVGALAVARDISTRKRLEQANARLASLVESSEDAIISKDLTGTIQTWNASAERIYGYSAEEAIGKSMTLLLPAGQEDEEQQILDQIRHGQRVSHFEAVRVRKDGNPIHVSLTISPIRERAGAVIGASHVAREIGERRRLEAAKAQLAAIVESSEDAIISKDLTGTIQTWNGGAKRVYGYSPLEAVGRNITFLLPTERANEYQEILARLRRGERVEPFETIRVRKDGKPIEVSLTISPIRDPAGNIIGTSHVARDITMRKVLEEQVRRTQIRQVLLERVFSAQEEERRRIARELHDEAGQLLASFLVGLRTLEDSENIEDAKAQGRWLRKITAQAIDELGRLARGLHPAVLDDYGLGVALNRYVTDFTNAHDIPVNLILAEFDPANLPRAIQIGLYRILQEALTNVARHSGAEAVSIVFTYSDEALEIAVSDDGCGFDTAADFVSSNHLGIQGMRERAAMLGGTVRIASVSQGTQVFIQIPLTEENFHRFSSADER